MDNCARLFTQIAAEGGVTPAKAKVAAYLFGLSRQGCSVERAAAALRRKPSTIRTMCREFLIDLSDYTPMSRERKKGDVEPRYALNIGSGA